MNIEELRAIQAPLKELYRNEPSRAVAAMHAKAILGDTFSSVLETQHGRVVAGLHPSAGGSGNEVCSGDMLLEALAACAGVTLNSVSHAMGIELRSAVVHAEGHVDFRGTLGVDRSAPVGFTSISLRFELDTDAADEAVKKMVSVTERYCVVYQTLKSTVEITTAIEKK